MHRKKSANTNMPTQFLCHETRRGTVSTIPGKYLKEICFCFPDTEVIFPMWGKQLNQHQYEAMISPAGFSQQRRVIFSHYFGHSL